MSKKRYAEYRARLESELVSRGDLSETGLAEVMRVLREVLDFDPEEKQYTRSMGERMMAARRARADMMGTTIYGMLKRDAEAKEKKREEKEEKEEVGGGEEDEDEDEEDY